MPDSEIAGLTEDTTPDTDDNVYVQDAAGSVDKRVPLSALPISTAAQTALNLKANAANAALTGVPTAPTAAPGTNTTQVASTEFTTAAVAAEAVLARNGDNITSGTVADARIAGSIARDSEVAAAYQPLAVVLTNTTASFTTTDETKLDGIEALADVTDATNVAAAGAVMDTGNETVAGIKTFSSGPLVPLAATTTDTTQAASTSFVQQEIAALPSVTGGLRWEPDAITVPGTIIGDVSLSDGIAGGETLNGGNASGEDLTLGSTSHATRGDVIVRDSLLVVGEDKVQTTPFAVIDVGSNRNISFTSGTASQNQLYGYRFNPTVEFAGNSALFAGFLFYNNATIRNDGSVRTFGTFISFAANPVYVADTSTFNATNLTGFSAAPTMTPTGGGSSTFTFVVGYSAGPVINTGATVSTVYGYTLVDASGTGAATLQVGVNIPTLAFATTNIGLRNASTTVHTPTTQAITVATNTIAITATQIRLNNTSGGSITLDPAGTDPIMVDGQQGQVITLLNTSANDVVLTDQGTMAGSNLRLGAATRTLTTNDSISLMFNTTIGDWVETGFTVIV